MDGLDWGRIRRFSSTAEPSSPEEMLYLMSLAGYKPVIEYCGGTEIGGGYITGTMVQPCAPSAFTTAAMGPDFVFLGDGRGWDRGEPFPFPPSIGWSTDRLNSAHFGESFLAFPPGRNAQARHRHAN